MIFSIQQSFCIMALCFMKRYGRISRPDTCEKTDCGGKLYPQTKIFLWLQTVCKGHSDAYTALTSSACILQLT